MKHIRTEEDAFLKCIMENEDNGVILMNKEGIISDINEAGKRILGLTISHIHPHPAGKIETGDIVIICDTGIGKDDGNLVPEDLEIIGISDREIHTGAAIVAIGVYGTKEKATYTFRASTLPDANIHLEKTVLGKHIDAFIDTKLKAVEISVDSQTFRENYIESYGHIVVLDGKSGEVKFFQTIGYSIRNEYIKNLLAGDSFKEKSPENKSSLERNVFDEIFPENNCIDDLRAILSGTIEGIENKIYEVNGRPMAFSMLPAFYEGEEPSGVVIKIAEISSLETALKSRNELLTILENKRKELFAAEEESDGMIFGNVVGNSYEMRKVKTLAVRAAKRKINVLITGESGTGKSFLAREIYREAGSLGPFVYVNCASISPTLFESEMFGYVGGAFTGANPRGSTGYFESANGGTIFLDEIGEIPMTTQVKLLNVIQNKEICRVGSAKVIPVNVRIIAATNLNLLEEVEQGRFRKDLFYRLNVFNIEMPPLRDCRDDLVNMAQKFLAVACRNNELEEKYLSNEAILKILSYDWPGNIRELQNVMERAAVFCDDRIIYPEYISIQAKEEKYSLRELLRNEEKKIITEIYKKNNGDSRKTMNELGLSKSVFYSKIKEYGID